MRALLAALLFVGGFAAAEDAPALIRLEQQRRALSEAFLEGRDLDTVQSREALAALDVDLKGDLDFDAFKELRHQAVAAQEGRTEAEDAEAFITRIRSVAGELHVPEAVAVKLYGGRIRAVGGLQPSEAGRQDVRSRQVNAAELLTAQHLSEERRGSLVRQSDQYAKSLGSLTYTDGLEGVNAAASHKEVDFQALNAQAAGHSHSPEATIVPTVPNSRPLTKDGSSPLNAPPVPIAAGGIVLFAYGYYLSKREEGEPGDWVGKANDAAFRAKEWIEDHPWQSAGIAIGALVAGAWFVGPTLVGTGFVASSGGAAALTSSAASAVPAAIGTSEIAGAGLAAGTLTLMAGDTPKDRPSTEGKGGDSKAEEPLETTRHGSQRLSDLDPQRGGVLSSGEASEVKASGQVMDQTGGGKVYIKEVEPGRYNVFVENEEGKAVTSFRRLKLNKLQKLARNYGWH